MKKTRKIITVLLTVCLMVSLTPSAVFAEGETDSEKTIMMGTSGVDDTEIIYFGQYEYKDNTYCLPWRVLDADKTNMDTSDGMFVHSEYALACMAFDKSWKPPLMQTSGYKGSDVQRWCEDFFEGDSFTVIEKKTVIATTKTDEEHVIKSRLSSYWISGYAADILKGCRVFLLSAEEAADYSAVKHDDTTWPDGSDVGGFGEKWWLRSTTVMPKSDTKYYDDEGKEISSWYNYIALLTPFSEGVNLVPRTYLDSRDDLSVRPAMNVSHSPIMFTSPAAEGKQSGTLGAEALLSVSEYPPGKDFDNPQQWKLTIYDEVRACFGAHLNAESDGNCVAGKTIKIDYSGAQTGTDEYISAMIVDEEGNVLYYGNLVNTNEEGVTEGTADLRLPAELPVGSYTLKVFNEQLNGDYKTDYSSQLIDIPLTISDPAPVLIPVSGERSSLSKATVKFTASEDVTYYYAVVEKGDPAPTIYTDEEKGRCLAGEETISLTDLTTAGAKDIYIVGKDSGGNLSNVIKIEIPKYKASYIPSEPPHTHEFGEWTVVKEPTETETGLKEHSCKCGYKETEEIPMLTSSEPAKPEAPADTDGEKEIAGSDDRYSNGLAAERGEGESSNVPKTGDTSDIPYWFALLALSFAGLTITLRKTRREKSRR